MCARAEVELGLWLALACPANHKVSPLISVTLRLYFQSYNSYHLHKSHLLLNSRFKVRLAAFSCLNHVIFILKNKEY